MKIFWYENMFSRELVRKKKDDKIFTEKKLVRVKFTTRIFFVKK